METHTEFSGPSDESDGGQTAGQKAGQTAGRTAGRPDGGRPLATIPRHLSGIRIASHGVHNCVRTKLCFADAVESPNSDKPHSRNAAPRESRSRYARSHADPLDSIRPRSAPLTLDRAPKTRGPQALPRNACPWVLWLLVLCGWIWATAHPASADLFAEEPTLLIESIQIDGLKQIKPELIIAESLLVEGASYREAELQQAVFRLQRLPFILDAGFALSKGSERGRYRLVITIEEIRRFFFGEDSTYTRFTNSVSFDSLLGQDTTFTPGGLAGIRFFVGKYGMLFGSVSSHGGLQAGFTQYNLFNRRAFLSVGLTTQTCCPIQVFPLGIDPTFSSWRNEGALRQGQITLGLPLQRRFQLRLQATTTHSERGERRDVLDTDQSFFRRASLDYEDQNQLRLELSLLYDSTDDPIFPSQGLSWNVALDYQQVDARLSVLPGGFFEVPIDLPPGVDADLPQFESEQLRIAFTLSQHWRWSRRQTVSLSARVAAGVGEINHLPIVERRTSDDLFDCLINTDGPCSDRILRLVEHENLDLIEGYFTARHSLSLWGAAKTRERGDFRLEHTLEFGYDRVSPDLNLAENPLYRKSFTSSLVFRNSWGLFRLSLQIADYGRDS